MIFHSFANRYRGVRLLLFLVALCPSCGSVNSPIADPLATAFEKRQSNIQVEGEGAVTRVLADDNAGSRHQRFVLRLSSGQTVLIQHNIDLAPRIIELKEGDTVSFYGEYIWNDQGGLIHWTHHDPARRHIAGWIKHRGRTYQ